MIRFNLILIIGYTIALQYKVLPLLVVSGFFTPPRGLTVSPRTTRTRIHDEHAATKSSVAVDLDFSNIEVASTSFCGSDPDRPSKINQDACFIQQLSSNCPNVFVAGVLDGHGKKGHILNAFLQKRIPEVIRQKLSSYFNDEEGEDGPPSEKDVELMLVEAFEQVNEEARLNTEVPAGRSGTTCVVCIFDARYGIIYTANVGDSRAIIAINTSIDKWLIQPLSKETITKRDDERKRIEAGEGRIDGGGNVWYGPVGIAMTRSLGNIVMRRAGIIPTPEVTITDVNEMMISHTKVCTGEDASCFIFLGTDGIFDVLKNEDVVNFVATEFEKTRELQNSSDSLVTKARDRWQAGLKLDVRIDDATCVIIRFEGQGMLIEGV